MVSHPPIRDSFKILRLKKIFKREDSDLTYIDCVTYGVEIFKKSLFQNSPKKEDLSIHQILLKEHFKPEKNSELDDVRPLKDGSNFF